MRRTFWENEDNEIAGTAIWLQSEYGGPKRHDSELGSANQRGGSAEEVPESDMSESRVPEVVVGSPARKEDMDPPPGPRQKQRRLGNPTTVGSTETCCRIAW